MALLLEVRADESVPLRTRAARFPRRAIFFDVIIRSMIFVGIQRVEILVAIVRQRSPAPIIRFGGWNLLFLGDSRQKSGNYSHGMFAPTGSHGTRANRFEPLALAFS
jgi:hypothetical protein